MKILFHKGLTRNLKIKNIPVLVLLNILRLSRGRDTKLRANASNEMLLKAAKCQGYKNYLFSVIKVKPTGWREVKISQSAQARSLLELTK